MSDLPMGRILGIFFGLLSVAVSTLAVASEPMPPALLLAERYRGDIDVSRYGHSGIPNSAAINFSRMPRPYGQVVAVR